MRRLLLLAVLVFASASMICPGAPAAAQSRLALLIANSAYQGAPPLTTPETDKALIAQTLEAAGYDVTQYADLTTQTIGAAFGAFVEKVKAAGPDATVFVYFSGYAAQENGDDYLIPVDAQVPTAAALPNIALPLAAVTKALTDVPSAARIIVLDAARDGGFGKAGGQPVPDGLALMGVPPGVLLAYSAAPGVYAPEFNGTNSPYANALTTVMRQPGLDIEQIFKGVRLQVNEATKGMQTPWMTSALNVEVKLFAAPAAEQTAAAAPTTLAPALGVSNIAVPPAKRRRVTKAAMRRMPADEAYRVAVEQDDLRDYQWFVEGHPDYPLAAQVWDTIFGRREEILWRRALASGTTRAYWNYLARYPNGPHAYAAHDWLSARDAPVPDGYVPVPESLPPGYYDEALGLPDLMPDGFADPAPVFFGGLAPEFVRAPRRFDQPLIKIDIHNPPPSPVNPGPSPTPKVLPDKPNLAVTHPTGHGQKNLPLINSGDLQREIQRQLDEKARQEKQKADDLAKQEQAKLGPPEPIVHLKKSEDLNIGQRVLCARGSISNANIKGMTDQQLKNCLARDIVGFKRDRANKAAALDKTGVKSDSRPVVRGEARIKD
jgi:uncharacterized caspase-like protein